MPTKTLKSGRKKYVYHLDITAEQGRVLREVAAKEETNVKYLILDMLRERAANHGLTLPETPAITPEERKLTPAGVSNTDIKEQLIEALRELGVGT